MTPQSPHHSTSGTPSDVTPVPVDAEEEWSSSDPMWKLLDEASSPEPNVFFARNVLREVRNLEPTETESVSWTARLAAIFTPPRLMIGATACACAFFAMQMIPSSDAPTSSGTIAQNAPVETSGAVAPAETTTVAVSDLSALVMVETLEAAAEDPTIFTRDEVVVMLGL